MKKRYSFILLAAGSFLLLNCKGGTQIPVTVELPSFEVNTPVKSKVTHALVYPGYTESQQKVDLVARVEGYIERVDYKPGSLVRKGDMLFTIEPGTYKDKLDRAQAAVKSAEAQLRLAKESLVRINEASKSKAVSEIDRIKAETSVEEAEANLKSSKAQADLTKKDLDYCYNRAPFAGRVTRLKYNQGEFVKGLGETLATLYDNTNVYVNFNVEDSRYVEVVVESKEKHAKGEKVSKKVQIILDEEKGLVFEGMIDYIAPSVDVSTGTIKMRAVVKNPDDDLQNGLYVKVRMPYETIDDALLVPETAIGSDQAGSYVYVVGADSLVSYRSVKLGESEGNHLREITEGLQPDDLVITKAILKVRDGMKIVPRKASGN